MRNYRVAFTREMATLVEKPPDITPKETEITTSGNIVGEVIKIKDTKVNNQGVLRIKSTVIDKHSLNGVVSHNSSNEKDIVKHDVIKTKKPPPDSAKHSQKTDADGKTDTSASRPVTGVSVTKIEMSEGYGLYDEHKREPKRPSSFSIRSEKKSGTPVSRSVSEYGRSTSVQRQPVVAPGRGTFDPLPSPKNNPNRRGIHYRVPTKIIRLATVTMSARTKPAPRAPMASLYYEEPKKPKKIIGWDEANNARPPLRIDMEGPGPCTYSPLNKPLNETNAPSWTFGAKTQPDKSDSGARTSWEKSWFQTPHLYQQKTDFYSDTSWPTPGTYSHRSLLGPRQRTVAEAPSFSIGTRKNFEMAKPGAEKQPSPNDYDRDIADKIIKKRGPAYSHQFRREGTVLWASKERTPGPAAYTPSVAVNKYMRPAYTIRSLRREKSHFLGPFSTF